MSQDEFGSSIETDMPSPEVEHSKHDSQSLQQELLDCTEKCEQAYVILQEAQTKLHLAEQVIQEQEALTQSLQKHVAQLEQDLRVKSEQLGQSLSDCEDLRGRLKRQQHHTSQLKAALERCLEAPVNNASKVEDTALESWSIAKLAEEQIANLTHLIQSHEVANQSSLQDVVKITPAIQIVSEQVSATKSDLETEFVVTKSNIYSEITDTVDLNTELEQPAISNKTKNETKAEPSNPAVNLLIASTIDPQKHRINSNPNQNFNQGDYLSSLVLPQVAAPHFIQALSDTSVNSESSSSMSSKRRVTSLAAVKLPQFPPLSRR